MPDLRANLLPIFGLLAALTFPNQGLPQQPTPKTQVPQQRLDRNGQPLPAKAIARLGTAQFRHQGAVTFLGFVGDANTLLGVGGDVDARIWDLSQAQPLRRFTVPPNTINQFSFNATPRQPLALSQDGKSVAWWDGEDIVVKNLTTNQETRSLSRQKLMEQGKVQPNSRPRLVLSADGQWLVLDDHSDGNKFGPGPGNGNSGRRVSVWKVASGDMVKLDEANPALQVNAFALSPDGKRLALLLQPNQTDKKMALPPPIVKVKEKEKEKEKDKGKDKDKDKETENSLVRFLDTATGKEIGHFKVEPTNSQEILFLGKGKTLAILHPNKGVALHDVASGKELKVFGAGVVGANGLQASVDGQRLLIVGSREVVLWEVATPKELSRVPLEAEKAQPNNPFGQRERSPVVALAPDGKTLATASKTTFRLWNADTGKEREQPEGNRDVVIALAFAPTGKQVLTGAADSPLLLWEANTGKVIRQFAFPAEDAEKQTNFEVLPMRVNQVRAVFTPDGQTIAALQRNKTLRRWEAATGKLLTWTKDAKKLSGFAYSPDGRTLALNSDEGVVRLVDPATGKERLQFLWGTMKKADTGGFGGPNYGMQSALTGFTSDSRTVIVAGFMLQPFGLDAGIYFFEAATGQARQKFESRFDVNRGFQPEIDAIAAALDQIIVSAVATPDGRLLATAGFSNIKVWDVAVGKEVRMFGGQGVVPWTAAFTPDGKWLIAGQKDGALRVWDLATSAPLADLPLHESAISALMFSPDGNTLATGSADTTVLLWNWAELRQQVTAAKKSTVPPTKLAGLWAELAGGDGSKAFSAQLAMIAMPAETVPFLKAHMQPVSPTDQAKIQKLLANLDHRQSKMREKAMKELEVMGDLAADAIQKQLQNPLSLEMLLRVQALNNRLQGPMKAGPLLQAKRAIEVLERIGTPAARQVLEVMANGAAGHRLTVDAIDSLQRLKKGTP